MIKILMINLVSVAILHTQCNDRKDGNPKEAYQQPFSNQALHFYQLILNHFLIIFMVLQLLLSYSHYFWR